MKTKKENILVLVTAGKNPKDSWNWPKMPQRQATGIYTSCM